MELSIVVLTTGDLDRAHRIVHSWAEAGIGDRLQVQFVFLMNRKDLSFPREKTEVTRLAGAETVYIGNDRYFGSCEENLYRIRDVVDIVKPFVLFVGETDEINWTNLAEVVRLAGDERLDAVLLNSLNVQKKRAGGTTSAFAVCNLSDDTPQNQLFRALSAGQSLAGRMAWPAVASLFGPIDWLAYIGNHLYSRNALRGLLKYRFVEHVYSFVYMQALYFSSSARPYRLFMPEVVRRISNDFLTEKASSQPDLGWLREHRVVHGRAATLWIANVHHLLEIEDDSLFSLLAMSLTVAHRPSGQDDGIAVVRNAMLRHLIGWIIDILVEKGGRSYYLRTLGPARLDDELWASLRFLRRLYRIAGQCPVAAVAQFADQLDKAVASLALYFEDVEHGGGALADASKALQGARAALPDAVLMYLQERSFRHYLRALAG